ncbi:MAG: hypothetical protein NUV58_02880 [Candidatus Roizmanbacteria bacterium]|nr:hypothetical protein [Candidatus Roizmanbacteria bacterium]
MKKTQFHIEKKLLKIEIGLQELVLEYKLHETFNIKHILTELIPSPSKKILGDNVIQFLSGNKKYTLVHILTEAQRTIKSIIQLASIAKQLGSLFTNKK